MPNENNNLNGKNVELTLEQQQQKQQTYDKYMDFIKRKMDFSSLSKTIVQDLINNRKDSVIFRKYTKEEIINALSNPQTSEKKIRDMSIYLYANSSHYRRLCNYFSKLATLNCVLVPSRLPKKYNKSSFLLNYRKVADLIDKFNFKSQLLKILNICMYQDTFAGLWFETEDSFDVVQLNNDYIKITSKEDGCLIYSLDFSFFNTRQYLLDSYGETIKEMYCNYVGYVLKDRNGKTVESFKGDPKLKWQEPPNQICIKVNVDQLLYALPPFAGIFPEILNLEDYKLLKKSGEILDRYKVITMKIPLNPDGTFQFDEKLAEKYYLQACANVDAGVGIILTPMDIDLLDFQQNAGADSDAVNEAESALFSASGSNKLLFGGGDKASSSSIDLSIRNDEAILFAMLRQVEDWVNKYIKKLNLPYDFKMRFLNQSIYTEEDVCKRYKEAASFGVSGSRSFYAASLGMSPAEVMYMSEIEGGLDFVNKWIPMKSSNTMNTGDTGSEGGAPKKDKIKDTTEAGQENDSNDE